MADVLDQLASGNLPIQQTIDNLLDQGSRAVVTDEDTAAAATTLISFINTTLKKAEDERKGWVKPLNDTVKRINDAFKKMTEPLTTLRNDIRDNKLAPWMREQERIAREEAARLAKEQEERALEQADALEKMGQGEAAAAVIENADRVNTIASTAGQQQPLRGSMTGSASLRRAWDFEVQDFAKVPDDYKVIESSAIRQFISTQRTEAELEAKRAGLRGKELKHAVNAAMQKRLAISGIRFFVGTSAAVR